MKCYFCISLGVKIIIKTTSETTSFCYILCMLLCFPEEKKQQKNKALQKPFFLDTVQPFPGCRDPSSLLTTRSQEFLVLN